MGKINDFSRNIRRKIGKLFFDLPDKQNKALDFSKIKSILFIRDDDKVGDMVISTLSFREIKKKYPDTKIFVLCGKNNKEIIKYNPYVDEIIEATGKLFKDLAIYIKLQSADIDLAVDFYEFPSNPINLLALRLMKPKFLIGFYKKKYNIYNLSIEEYFFDKHITQRHKYLLYLFGIEKSDLSYDIFTSNVEKNEAENFIKNSKDKLKIIINPFSASKHRTFNYDKLQNLITLIKQEKDCVIYILCPPARYNLIKTFENTNNNIFIFQSKSILSAAELIRQCDITISPDTSVIHIASAFNKKTIGLYLDFSNREEKTDIIWGPNNPNAVVINVNTKNGKLENDIKNIDNLEIIKALRSI
jgi:ADP-heptose:LPS heptosyltransferase